MAVLVSDVIPKLKGYARNENLTDERAITVIDSAAVFVANQLGLPGYEKEYVFDFDQNQATYALPADFAEPISLRYKDDLLNKGGDFKWKPPELIFKKVKFVFAPTRLFSHYLAGSSKVLYVLAKNSTSSLLVDTFDFDNAANWAASNDATGVGEDSNVKQEGAASLNFEIDTGLSGNNRATLLKTIPVFNLLAQVDKGIFKVWAYLPTVTNLDTISFRWGSGVSDYYLRVVSAQEDGTAFVAGWNKLAFAWEGATVVNSPDASAINRFQFDYDYQASFVGGTNFRLDHLRLIVPDPMILTYYTAYRGKNNSDAAIFKFSAATDKFLFGDSETEVAELIALHAAILLNPQLVLENKNVRESYMDFLTLLRRRYPRKRIMNLLMEPQRSLTSWN